VGQKELHFVDQCYFSCLTYIYYDNDWNKNVCQINENESFEDVETDISQKRDMLHTFPLVTG
jgi:hypothetical protein